MGEHDSVFSCPFCIGMIRPEILFGYDKGDTGIHIIRDFGLPALDAKVNRQMVALVAEEDLYLCPFA